MRFKERINYASIIHRQIEACRQIRMSNRKLYPTAVHTLYDLAMPYMDDEFREREREIEQDKSIKPGSYRYWNEIFRALLLLLHRHKLLLKEEEISYDI